MKKGYIILIVVAAVVGIIAVLLLSPLPLFIGDMFMGITGGNAEIEIDSYRLCQDNYGEDVIIVKYLLKNAGKEPTCLYVEGDCYVYQNGVELTEYYEDLPRECNYDSEDQYKNVKGGVEYYAEIAYLLESRDADVQVEVDDYGLFEDKKEKVFQLR